MRFSCPGKAVSSGGFEMAAAIRYATRDDYAAIVRLIRQLAEDAGEKAWLTEEYVETYLSFPGSGALLAEEGGRVVGLLTYHVRPGLYHAADCCLIDELVVDRPVRRQGIGSALLGRLLQEQEHTDCAEVGVSCMPDNERAIRLYHRHGLVDEALLLERHFNR
jgi:ribosomal protein S18 acetylase RimI-like enzyme